MEILHYGLEEKEGRLVLNSSYYLEKGHMFQETIGN